MLLAKEKAELDKADEACWGGRRKRVAGLSRVVSISLYEEVSFVQRLKRSEEIRQMGACGERTSGQRQSHGKALRKEKAGVFNEQQRSQCGWRGGSDGKSRTRGGANHKGLREHRKGCGFYSGKWEWLERFELNVRSDDFF